MGIKDAILDFFFQPLSLQTHNLFGRRLQQLGQSYKTYLSTQHMVKAKHLLGGDELARILNRDKTGQEARKLLVDVGTHFILAADKIVKEQENLGYGKPR